MIRKSSLRPFPAVALPTVAFRAVSLRVLAFTLLMLPAGVLAQDVEDAPADSNQVRVTLIDGTTHVGQIVSDDDAEIVILTRGGIRITIPRSQIRSIESVTIRTHRGREMRLDPNRSRLLFASTARPVGAGQGYVALYEIFFPFVAIGVGDIGTLAGGVSLLPGVSQQLLYLAPKVTLVEVGETSLALGGFAATLTGSGGYGGIVYGVGTHGTPYAALTGGVGFLFGEGEFINTPIILIGGEYQLSNNIKLLSENYVIPEADNALVISAGVRFIGDAIAADFGLFTSPEAFGEIGFPFVPWLGFSYKWR